MAFRTRTLIAGLLAVVAGGTIAVVAAAHISRTSTSVGATMAVNDDYVYGAVSSDAKGCTDRRKVKLFRKRAGADKLVGSGRSIYNEGSASGPYTITSETARFPAGAYYSRADQVDLAPGEAHDHLCKADSSPRVTAEP